MHQYTFKSEILKAAYASIQIPIDKFIETGIYVESDSDPSIPEELRKSGGWITYHQTRRVCRNIARELKRPFITVEPRIKFFEWEPGADGRMHSHALDEPKFQLAVITMPRRKYLTPLVTPLLLACGDNAIGTGGPVRHYNSPALWRFSVSNEDLWNEYYASLDRPEMREARRTPLR